jgi:hypothetical protein
VRVSLLLARAASPTDFEAAIRACGAVPRSAGSIRIGIRHPDDPLAAAMGERRESEPIDGVVEVTLGEGATLDDAPRALASFRDPLAGVADFARSAAVAGTCYRFLAKDGPVFVALAARRDPAITMAELTEWWRDRHGPLALRIVRPAPLAYEQLHADRAASRVCARVAGMGETVYDMVDTISVESPDAFRQATSDPETAAKLYEDEVGHVDHSSIRGALQLLL